MNHMMAWQHSCLEWQAEEQTLIEEHLLLQMHSLKVKSGLLKLMDLLTHVKTTGWNYQFSIGHWDQTQIQEEWDSKEAELLAQSLSLFSLKSELMPEGWKVASAVSIFKYRCERRWRNYRLASLTSIAEKIREKSHWRQSYNASRCLGQTSMEAVTVNHCASPFILMHFQMLTKIMDTSEEAEVIYLGFQKIFWEKPSQGAIKESLVGYLEVRGKSSFMDWKQAMT